MEAICRAFLEQHAPKKAAGESVGENGKKPASSGQFTFRGKIIQEKRVAIPHEAKASSSATSAGIESSEGGKSAKGRRKAPGKSSMAAAEKSSAPTKRPAKTKAVQASAVAPPTHNNPVGNTPLRIPYGNKDVAQKLGARYAAGGWYAPPGVDLTAFSAQGWL